MKSIFTGQRFHRQNCYRRKIFKTYTYSNRIIPQLPIKKRTFTCLLELFIFLFDASKLDQRTAEYIPFHRMSVQTRKCNGNFVLHSVILSKKLCTKMSNVLSCAHILNRILIYKSTRVCRGPAAKQPRQSTNRKYI